MSDTFSEWHFVHVIEGDPEGEDAHAELWHPGCAFRVEVGAGGPGVTFEYLCGFQWEADNVGEMESLGNPDPGWYVARHWRTERSTMNSAWSEVETGIEVLDLVHPAFGPFDAIGA